MSADYADCTDFGRTVRRSGHLGESNSTVADPYLRNRCNLRIGYSLTLLISVQNSGNDTDTTSFAPLIVEGSLALSDATAHAMAMRWSPQHASGAPFNFPPPLSCQPSGSSAIRAPMRFRFSTVATMRSDSFTRSSFASLSFISQPRLAAKNASNGSSSIKVGTTAPDISRVAGCFNSWPRT